MRERRTLLLIAVLLLLPPIAAEAKVILVQPGPGTPFQDAIDAAAPGDTLRVAGGIYSEAIVVNKALRILGAPSSPYSEVDAGCAVANAVEVAADGVTIRGLIVRGGTTSGVDVQNRDHVQLEVSPFKTCIGTQNAINVVSSTRVKLIGSGSGGVYPVGLHLSGIAAGADVLVRKFHRW
jgi:nitrous oxidase accessory protein NosD